MKSTEKWSEYAFENNKEYHLTFYDKELPIAHITNSFFDITVDYLAYNQGSLFKHLSIVLSKYNMNMVFKENRKEKFPNGELFRSQINNYVDNEEERIQNELIFKLNGDANIFITKLDKSVNKSFTEAKKTKANISNNFIRPPKDYKDYAYLLHYKNILKPEYLDF